MKQIGCPASYTSGIQTTPAVNQHPFFACYGRALFVVAAAADDHLPNCQIVNASESRAAKRVRWFSRGYDTGDLRQGDTFNAGDL